MADAWAWQIYGNEGCLGTCMTSRGIASRCALAESGEGGATLRVKEGQFTRRRGGGGAGGHGLE